MAKKKNLYICRECGHETSGWLGRCPACGAWNTMEESAEVPTSPRPARSATWLGEREARAGEIVQLDTVAPDRQDRLRTGIAELDQVLGDGFVRGSLVLLGGNPGIGKSTMALQALACFPPERTLYISGEESPAQLRMRADRLGFGDRAIRLLADTDFSVIERRLTELKPDLAVVDSIQTVYSPELSALPGSVSQIREVTMGLLCLAKAHRITLVLTGHVTKEGALAGPRILEHMVDAVLYFEGEKDSPLRMLRAVKNRFGATDELGVFHMTERGLVSMAETDELLFGRGARLVPGSVVTAALEGSRPLLLELQALTVPSSYGTPLRMTQGIDRSRLSLLLAVLAKVGRIDLSQHDAYVNVTGGVRIRETASDLAILTALVSSFRDRPTHVDAVILGEVGLTGEIRNVTACGKRVEAALRSGRTHVVVPAAAKEALRALDRGGDGRIFYVSHMLEAFDLLFSGASGGRA